MVKGISVITRTGTAVKLMALTTLPATAEDLEFVVIEAGSDQGVHVYDTDTGLFTKVA